MAQIQILDYRKFPSRDPMRAGKLDTMVTYMVDGKRDQTHVTFVKKDTVTDTDIQAQIRADLQEKDAQVGKKLTV